MGFAFLYGESGIFIKKKHERTRVTWHPKRTREALELGGNRFQHTSIATRIAALYKVYMMSKFGVLLEEEWDASDVEQNQRESLVVPRVKLIVKTPGAQDPNQIAGEH
jgi:hypothetical protein